MKLIFHNQFSKVLNIAGNKEIGLKLVISGRPFVLFCFLTGITFDCLSKFGHVPIDNEKLNKYSNGCAISLIHIICFNNFILMPSYPDDFLDLND